MRPPKLVEVSLGLTIVQWGFRLVAGGVVILLLLVVLAALNDQKYGSFEFHYTMLAVVVLGFCMAAAGLLVGFIGRVGCSATPPEMPIARVRVRLAVTLEGCGWLSGVVNGGVACANSNGSVSLAVEVLYAVFLFAFALFTAGRAFFYAFTVALAKAVDMKPAPRPSAVPLMLIVMGSTAVSASVGLQLTDGSRPLTFVEVLIPVGAFLATLCVLGTLYSIGRWFRRLREAVTQCNTRPAEPLLTDR